MKVLWFAALGLLAGLSLHIPQATAGDLRYTAKVFDLDSHRSKLLYTYRSESEVKGDDVVLDNRFSYPDGKGATHEQITMAKDGHVVLYKQEQLQQNANGTIEVKDGKAKFTWKKDGKEKTGTEDAGSDFIVGSQIPLEIGLHWSEILKGDTLKYRLAVLERCEAIHFDFKKEGEGDVDGKKAILVKMTPTSFFIKALVNPLHFYMSEDGKALLEIKGRTTVKRDNGNGKFSDLDAEIVYEKGPGPEIPYPPGGNSK